MKLATATKAPIPSSVYGRKIAWVYAGILIVMATLQLFEFEDFLPLVESFWLPGGRAVAALLGAGIVTAEVFALPFLLGMTLSPLMRWVSMAFGLLVPVVWMGVALWLNMTVNAVSNVGLLGTKLDLPVGWWAVFFTAALLVVAVWSLWGMLPARTTAAKG